MNIMLAPEMEMRDVDRRGGATGHECAVRRQVSLPNGCAPLASPGEAREADRVAEPVFPVARSVQRAVDHLRAHPCHGLSIHDLAQVAGVTTGTLRRNFRACLGVTATQLIQQIRVEWVRSRLESATESRSISELSLAAGFGAPGMMSRAYQRRFGETPSQTRARAFRAPDD